MNYLFKVCLLIIIIIGFTGSLTAELQEHYNKIITNPEPNMVEKEYVEIVKAGELNEDLGNSNYLFGVMSAAMDKKNNLFVYDKFQGKVLSFDNNFKFIRSFGNRGEGPGDFRSGRGVLVYMNVGLDGNLYIRDSQGFKVMVWNPQGELVREFKYAGSKSRQFLEIGIPQADASGNILYHTYQDGEILVFNEKGKKMFSPGIKTESQEYLFYEPRKPQYSKRLKEIIKQAKKKIQNPLQLTTSELNMLIMPDSRILLYFRNKAQLYIFKDGRLELKRFLWPKEAIQTHKNRINPDRPGYLPIFAQIFPDGDEDGVFYLHFGYSREKKKNYLYKFNIKCELLKVLYIDRSGSPGPLYTSFRLKQNGIFFAKEKDSLAFYKEKK